jgi:hypothetical protein
MPVDLRMIMCRKDVARLLVLLLVLLFNGSMNLFCVAVDSDNDDDTPPVNVELSILPASIESSQDAPPSQLRVAPIHPSAGTSAQCSVPISNSKLKEPAVLFSVPLRC